MDTINVMNELDTEYTNIINNNSKYLYRLHFFTVNGI